MNTLQGRHVNFDRKLVLLGLKHKFTWNDKHEEEN